MACLASLQTLHLKAFYFARLAGLGRHGAQVGRHGTVGRFEGAVAGRLRHAHQLGSLHARVTLDPDEVERLNLSGSAASKGSSNEGSALLSQESLLGVAKAARRDIRGQPRGLGRDSLQAACSVIAGGLVAALGLRVRFDVVKGTVDRALEKKSVKAGLPAKV